MLAAAMIQNGLYTSGRFVVIAPAFNTRVWNAVHLYRQHLAPEPSVKLEAVALEAVIPAMAKAGATEIAATLHDRYCNFDQVDELI
jgi:hypothetical protein